MQIPWWSLLLGNNPDGELWFLYVLFLFSMVVIWIVNEKTEKILFASALIIIFFAPLFPSKYAFPGISLSFSCYQIGFYALGICLGRNWGKVYNRIQKKSVLCISFVLCAFYGITLQLNGGDWWLKDVIATVLIVLLMSALIYISELNGKICGVLDYLGCHSMEIYIIHAPILIIGRKVLPYYVGSNWVYVIILTTLAVTFSLIFDKCVLNRWQWIGRLLVGKKKKYKEDK